MHPDMSKCPANAQISSLYRDENSEYKSQNKNIVSGGHSLKLAEKQNFRTRVWQIIHSIPPGRVATYGQIASLADHPNQARLVGKILSQLPNDTKLPWHRVLNAQGRITSPGHQTQKTRLAEEQVQLINGRVNLKIYQWQTQ